ncbi:acyltransferase family protein [Algoriphagus marincola]|uniref:acyltransferase family protein n=1 Tax=Algoriphagus marincola TaxID=264027 RepID=UPI00040E0B16|nr:acyltransferase family protein [Algoriphagus marincola]
MTTQRRYDIDWLRVIAIALLLIYHIAIVFQPWAMFLGFIKSEELLTGLWKPMTLLNVWRIPFLFFVSGMGVYFAIRKRNWKELLMERSRRILLPFLFGVVAIVPIHFLIFQAYYNLPLGYSAHPAHLWFLGNISAYVLLLAPIFFYLKKSENGAFKKTLAVWMSNPLGPLSLSLLFVLEVILVKPQVFEMYALTWHGFFIGILAFFCGFLLVYSGEAFWKTVLNWRWAYLGLALGMYLTRWMVYDLVAPGYLMAIESIFWIMAIFGFGYKYLNKPSAILSYLSQAAYPVYILHMVALHTAASVILPLNWPIFFKFPAIIGFTGIFCFVIFEFLIRRIPFLRPLFGLSWDFKTSKIKAISVPSPD